MSDREKVYELSFQQGYVGAMSTPVSQTEKVRCDGFSISGEDDCVHFWSREETERVSERVDELVVPLSNLRYFKRVRD